MPNDKNQLSTEPLDDAMKELLDLFNQCNNDKPSNQKQLSTNIDPIDDEQDVSTSPEMFAERNSETSQTKESTDTTMLQNPSKQHGKSFCSSQFDESDTIEKLQQRQSEFQNQLDEVLKVAKELELKQKRKLNGLVQGDRSGQQGESDDGDDDIELIEFHQIEIELRISELNRQLSNIQEELRLRLYKRLQSKTTGGLNNSTIECQQQTSKNNRDPPFRRNSAQTDESTPPSSSCSDETTATSTDTLTHSITKNSIDSELANQFDKCSLSKLAEEFTFQSTKCDRDDLIDGKDAHPSQNLDMTTPKADNTKKETENIDLQLAFEQNHNYEVILPTTGSDQKKINNIPSRTPSRIPTMSNAHRNFNNNDSTSQQKQRLLGTEVSIGSADNQTASNGYRNCPTNIDLERIEEGEEDDFDYYCNSERFRSIYEEKISPMIQATETDGCRSARENQQQHSNIAAYTATAHPMNTFLEPTISKNDDKTSNYASPKPSKDNRFNINNVNSAKRGNRPLTIYLPRPDEDLDLVEAIQSLGHDLNILSTDLKITPTSAQGYLYKSCSNNSKKWLKRYFHFNRESKVLSYYENEEQLVRKVNLPKCMIPFDEISDVYVDHRLSEKQKGATRKSYVFVLVTIKRKYLLASSKAETMRAWIDILFTAAKANDYFQQIEDNEKSLSFNYDEP
uniref:Pleckstrin y-like domain family B member 1 n=1 Tax=Aceria tosichella TaxID=561515 RepID=A0A6G1SAT1_9ACAR